MNSQIGNGIEIEHIIIDGGSCDASLAIIESYRRSHTRVLHLPANGPAAAINAGLELTTGDVLAWLNADDRYHPGAFQRIARAIAVCPNQGLYFGRCRIIDEAGFEIRHAITKFKELFFNFSSRFTLQCLNYISQPACFFLKEIGSAAGFLRTDLEAAWDYEYWLRLLKKNSGVFVPGSYLSDFRWHQNSISGKKFKTQFFEEFYLSYQDAGMFSPQAIIHSFVSLAIILSYSLMKILKKYD